MIENGRFISISLFGASTFVVICVCVDSETTPFPLRCCEIPLGVFLIVSHELGAGQYGRKSIVENGVQ